MVRSHSLADERDVEQSADGLRGIVAWGMVLETKHVEQGLCRYRRAHYRRFHCTRKFSETHLSTLQ